MNQKKKGNKNERVVANWWKEYTGREFQRTPSSGGLRWKKADNIAGDIVCSEPNYIFPFSIEVKAHKVINFAHLLYDVNSDIDQFWEQAKDDAKRAKKIPMLFMRYNRLPEGFYFIVWDRKFAKSLYAKIGKYPKPYMVVGKLFITTTDALKKIKYESLHKLGMRCLNVL